MNELELTRRDVLRTWGAVAAGMGALASGCAAAPDTMREPVKWSSGVQAPRFPLPADACDCHHHLYDDRYPWAAAATLKPGNASVADYRRLQQRLKTTRNVIVQPSSYGTDNRLLVDSLAQFGGRARGVAVVDTGATDAQLRQLHAAGVRGIRISLTPPGITTWSMIKPLAARVAPLGWHVQVHAFAADLLPARDLFADLPCPVVFDHLGRVPQPDALHHPAATMIRDLLQRDRAYVKLSGFYFDSKVGAPGYTDSIELARAYAAEAPERVLWGSDWPHPTEQRKVLPDDAVLLDALALAVGDESKRHQVLVENPTRLYFSS